MAAYAVFFMSKKNMAMKQTQTKLFDFSDVGLDFCAGSKSLFPDRFKRMLALGYNSQTVASVSVAGNQVTFEYGITHGYVADRILKVSSGPLAAINGGEFVIDSATATSLTMTIDAAPISIAGGFTTTVASLGWELVYEQANIHVYKLKYLDETFRYLRLCFQDVLAYRNRISPCIGNSYDADTGFINDANAFQENINCMTPASFAWEFSTAASSTQNSYSYSQGLATFGKAMVVGSAYHLAFLVNTNSSSSVTCRINSILPISSSVEGLSNHAMIGEYSSTLSGSGNTRQIGGGEAYLNSLSVGFTPGSSEFASPSADTYLANYYSSNVDGFNTTSAFPLFIFERATGQMIGAINGMYKVAYRHSSPPINTLSSQLPNVSKDIDLQNNVLTHGMGNNSGHFYALGFAVEEIKIGA